MRDLRLALVCAVLVLSSGHVEAGGGHVYLLKGLANVFSTGLDNYAADLTRRGVAVTVANHSEAGGLAMQAAQLQKSGRGPIIIVGHSLGGAASTQMAEIMKQQGAKVALIVNYGPPGNQIIPSNVSKVVNYFGMVGGQALPGPGFKGAITNINLAQDEVVNHFNMDKISWIQSKTEAQVFAVLGRGERRGPPATPVSSAPSATTVAASTASAASH